MTSASAGPRASAILVVGGGMAGITAAIESAELGREVYLVERSASLGGRVAGMKHYFPKLCPPYCGLEINYRRIKDNPSITVLTSAEVTAIAGAKGAFTVTVMVRPRFIRDEARDPVGPYAALDRTVANAFDYGLSKRRAVQVPHELAYPYRAAVDEAVLLDPALKDQVASLPDVDLAQQPQTMTLKVGAIIWATGWRPYDPNAIGYLRYAEHADVITSLEMERLAATNGPTAGKLTRPSDGRPARRVAFVQCAGSRDARHLPYCSAVCCMASLKQATYVREADPENEVWIFYIDIRANKYESFYRKVQADPKVHLVKGKAGGIERDAATGDLVVLAEDAATGQLARVLVDLVVLATGIVPQTKTEKVPYEGLAYDEHGFLISAPAATGICAAGCVKRPADVAATVQDATGASLRAARL